MSILFQKYNPLSGKKSVGPVEHEDIVRSPGDITVPPFVAARRQIDANRAILNHQQNIGRASFEFTDHALTLLPNTYYIAPFIHYDTLPSMLRAWTSMYCAAVTASGVAFVCMEPGWYNLKGGLNVEISVPAVPATKIYKADAALIYSPKNNPYYSWFWQDTQYADVRVIPGMPETAEQTFMFGWSHTFAEKLWMDCGDMVWLVHRFTGLGQIEYLESYQGRLAIQRTGEPFIEEECCNNV